ncbi:uncharacterized protein C1orf131 homolog [Thalassophryne amazonica]|uniref:uncharacterized protein C1orf131 homolog n=1 Tax=Thalassophryne amazonica TaxID=390379 RepID=UPI001470DC26|nr:uncharacterized protein C1orf131 homolog [Thalassophryne amazonica]
MSSESDRNEDEDCVVLEQVLDKLYDFGNDSALKRKSQKKRKQKRFEGEPLLAPKEVYIDIEDGGAQHSDVAHIKHHPEADKIPGSAVHQVSQVEVVTFQNPTKKHNKATPAPENSSNQNKEKKPGDQPDQLSMEKARLEVHRFGITGYKKEEQRFFEQDRAIMLGARPPKKQYVNYKMLQKQIKEKKQKVKEEFELDQKKKKKRKQNNQRVKKKEVSSGSGKAPSGQMGRFKNGMLILSSKEIQKIKGSVGSKKAHS